MDAGFVDKIEQQIAESELVMSVLELPLEAASRAMELGKKHNKCTVLNPAPAVKLDETILKNVDYLTPNETEMRILLGLAPDDQTPNKELAKRLQDMTENMLQFNEVSGEYELPAEARMQLKAAGEQLGINTEITRLCLFIALLIEKRDLVPENTPHSVAAGIIYFVAQTCKLNISKRSVNKISEISEVTINKCYKKLNKIHNEEKLIPSMILIKYSD